MDSDDFSKKPVQIQAWNRLTQMGLDPAQLRIHQAHVKYFLQSKTTKTFPILDTCRIENSGIQKIPDMGSKGQTKRDIVAFIPAAGASSRYLEPLAGLMKSLRERNHNDCKIRMAELVDLEFFNHPLPDSIKKLREALAQHADAISETLISSVLSELESPKAFYPAVLDGATFLDLKRMEHKVYSHLVGEIYVTPPDRSTEFLAQAQKQPSHLKVKCYEQGPQLATARFDVHGDVSLDPDGQPSMVPAGHGSLFHLFDQIPNDFPEARGLFIRNIDNVSGTSDRVIQVTNKFLAAFQESLECMNGLREALSRNDLQSADLHSIHLLKLWSMDIQSDRNITEQLFKKLFHAPSKAGTLALQNLASRPLVLMGQVPNTGKDVGGTCVFTEINGFPQKLCLEVPHASQSDKTQILENPIKSTHFNPVFVAAEIPKPHQKEHWNDHPFWLIAKKSWLGQETYYQESILYEMIGSSAYCNVIFVEVPRFIFNPHKSLKDAGIKTTSDWIPQFVERGR